MCGHAFSLPDELSMVEKKEINSQFLPNLVAPIGSELFCRTK